jgi:hypothetical protein
MVGRGNPESHSLPVASSHNALPKRIFIQRLKERQGYIDMENYGYFHMRLLLLIFYTETPGRGQKMSTRKLPQKKSAATTVEKLDD